MLDASLYSSDDGLNSSEDSADINVMFLSEPSSFPSRPLRLLIVDDEIQEDDALIALLSLHGLSVDCVKTGTEALSRTSASPYDAIVLDLHLSDVLGVTVLSHWRKVGLAVPVIAVTGWYGDSGHEEAVLALGAAVFMRKPLDAAVLASVIEAAVIQARQTLPHGARAVVRGDAERYLPDNVNQCFSPIQERTCQAQIDAPDAWIGLLQIIERHLRAQRRFGATEDQIHDAAVDALIEYEVNSASESTAQAAVPRYLYFAARRNLSNLLQAERRRLSRERAFAVERDRRAAILHAPSKLSSFLPALPQATKDFTEAERAVLQLRLLDERRTEAYAQALSVDHCAAGQKRSIVRRVKERVVRRIQRALRASQADEPRNGKV